PVERFTLAKGTVLGARAVFREEATLISVTSPERPIQSQGPQLVKYNPAPAARNSRILKTARILPPMTRCRTPSSAKNAGRRIHHQEVWVQFSRVAPSTCPKKVGEVLSSSEDVSLVRS